MWEQGTLLVNDAPVRYCVKHCPEPSEEYGIDGHVTLNYSRGWDIEPEDETSQLAYMLLLRKYN